MTLSEKTDWMPDYVDLLNAQRKLGYTVEAAIADIADNPYDAGASWCYIDMKTRNVTRGTAKIIDHIVFADNGRGMTKYELSKALVPATTGRIRKYTNELGYFGVGLIASGLSLGNRVEVFTRGFEGDFFSYIDFNEKEKNNSPVNIVRPCSANESRSVLDAYLRGAETGTVVWISNLQLTSKNYDVMMDEINYHLSTTYYGLKDKYKIILDGKAIKPWDFIEKNDSPFVSPVKLFTVEKDAKGNPIHAEISLQMSYVKVTNHNRWFEIMGRTNENQGGALVRNGRMLTRGDMMGISKKNPANNALRFVLSYDDVALDNHIFALNVQKDKCQIVDKDFKIWLDKEIKQFIKEVINPLNKKYRVATPKTGAPTGKKSGASIPVAIVRQRAIASNSVIAKLHKLDVDKLTAFDALTLIRDLHLESKKFVEEAN
jgi:hypothetical protein